MKTIQTWCDKCYCLGNVNGHKCPKCGGSGYTEKTMADHIHVPKAGHPEPQKHQINPFQQEDKAFDRAYRRWELSKAKKDGFTFEEFMKMDL